MSTWVPFQGLMDLAGRKTVHTPALVGASRLATVGLQAVMSFAAVTSSPLVMVACVIRRCADNAFYRRHRPDRGEKRCRAQDRYVATRLTWMLLLIPTGRLPAEGAVTGAQVVRRR